MVRGVRCATRWRTPRGLDPLDVGWAGGGVRRRVVSQPSEGHLATIRLVRVDLAGSRALIR